MKLITVLIKGGNQPQREALANRIARKHNLDDRPATLGDVALIRSYRPEKVVKNIVKKESRKNMNHNLTLTLQFGGAW